MLLIVGLLASLLIIAVSLLVIFYVAPEMREKQIRETIALGGSIKARHRKVHGFGKHLAY